MPKILIVDDYEDNLYVASLVLSRDNHEIITATSGREAIKKAETELPDVVLLDIQMPEIDGFEVCKRLKSNELTRKIPVVFLTAKYKDSESLAKGLELGAEDYIVKPFNNPELRARVNVMARLKSQMDELASKNQELARLNEELEGKNKALLEAQNALQELAITDPLTGLHNRRYFTERLHEEFLLTQREKHSITLMILDIDHFKRINDTYGHQGGDQVLTEFATILKKNVRQHEIVARYGGEEFIIAMFHIDDSAVRTISERIRVDVEQHVFEFGDQQLHVTCSIGVASYPTVCQDDASLDALVREADTALYHAKETGRNRVVCAPLASS